MYVSRFVNREDVDFDTVDDYEPLQEWELVQDSQQVFEYSTR